MAIHTQQTLQIEGGFAKELDEHSTRFILDNLQKTQYSYPYKSTVRELVSNGIDAVRERNVAVSILTGQSKVEDHYVKLEGDEYRASHFDEKYYDPAWLSDDQNVYITYREGGMLNKDKLIVRDNGVGLWGDRLVGYFKLSYSTKRLSRFGLGKYGIGAKAAFSTGASFYTVINRYNGREMWFNVYINSIEPCTPKYNMETGKENPILVMNNGFSCHWMPTDQKNGLEIVLETKKHHKQSYIDAVKSQLLYFDNIDFRIEAENGSIEKVPVKAEIIYEDDIMILSDNHLYTKPHILINRVNYGNIDFKELELEDRLGNISILMKPEEVSVAPSREHVLWDETTQKAIVTRFKEVQAVSEGLLQRELNQADFMKWLKACILIKNKINTEQADGLVARLAQLVDLKSYEPVYKPDPDFRLDRNLFAGIKVRKIFGKTVREGSSYKFKVERVPVGLSDLVNNDLPVIVQQSDTNWLKDKYLLEDVYPEGFITVWLNETEIKKPVVTEEFTEEMADQYQQSMKAALFNHAREAAIELRYIKLVIENDHNKYEGDVDKAVERVLDRWNRFNKYILESEGLQRYEDLEVSQEYIDRNKEKVETGDRQDRDTIRKEDEVQTKEARLSAEARRKQQGKTILFTPTPTHPKSGQLYEWHKLEIPVSEIDQWENDEVFYSSEDNSSLLQLAAFITRPEDEEHRAPFKWEEEEEHLLNIPGDNPPYTERKWMERRSHLTAFDGNTAVKLIKVAKDRVKFYQDFKHVHQFFAQVNHKTKTITMSNALIKWNTARYINEHLPKLRFFSNFKVFNEEYAGMYQMIKTYCDTYYRSVKEHVGKYKEIRGEEYDDMITHLDKVAELQIFVRNNKDDAPAIASAVKELFGTGLEDKIQDGAGLDINMYDAVHKLLDYAEPIGVLLNCISRLTDGNSDAIPEELETEIRHYIQFKQSGH